MSWIELLRDLGVFGFVIWAVQALGKRWIDRAAHEHQVRFSALHEKRVEVISETYERLVKAEQALKWASDVSPADDETRKRVGEFGDAANEFFNNYARTRIWLSPALCERLDEFWAALKEAGYTAVDALSKHREVTRTDCRSVMAERCDPLKAALESEFRKVLGVT